MCGRYSFAAIDAQIEERFGVRVRTAIYKARYNCAPTQQLAVISGIHPEELSFWQWGLIPFWAKDRTIGSRLINAKSETVAEKPSFRSSFKSRRCLVPADSFFEWKKDVHKTPYRILMKDERPFAMAGIWDLWSPPGSDPVYSFSILTTTPNELMAGIHDRMPVILHEEDEKRWISALPPNDLLDLLKPYPSENMKAYPVSKLVNSPRNDTIEIFTPAA